MIKKKNRKRKDKKEEDETLKQTQGKGQFIIALFRLVDCHEVIFYFIQRKIEVKFNSGLPG